MSSWLTQRLPVATTVLFPKAVLSRAALKTLVQALMPETSSNSQTRGHACARSIDRVRTRARVNTLRRSPAAV